VTGNGAKPGRRSENEPLRRLPRLDEQRPRLPAPRRAGLSARRGVVADYLHRIDEEVIFKGF
jgi:hypothetical protein